jgi:hypothetical protein
MVIAVAVVLAVVVLDVAVVLVVVVLAVAVVLVVIVLAVGLVVGAVILADVRATITGDVIDAALAVVDVDPAQVAVLVVNVPDIVAVIVRLRFLLRPRCCNDCCSCYCHSCCSRPV